MPEYKTYDNVASLNSSDLKPLGDVFVLLENKTKLTELWLTIRNQSGSAFSAFELRYQSSPRSSWAPWTFNYTSPASGSILKGNNGTSAPASLAAGATIQLVFDRLGGAYAIQAFGTLASGTGSVEYSLGAYGA